MSEQASSQIDPKCLNVPGWLQVTAWIMGIGACVLGMLDLVAEWAPTLATAQLIVLAIAPVVFMLPRRPAKPALQSSPVTASDWIWCVILGGLSFGVCFQMGRELGNLPPAYHDEFSYLFQAKAILAGHFSFPSHPLHPELFDQMHVLNEGRMGSRYYPGTGLWLAPFVAAGHPFLAPSLAGLLSTVLVYWIGRELGGRLTGIVSGAAMALSPGIGLFGTTLLAHHPTMLGLSLFLLGVTRWRRTRAGSDAFIAGIGLSFAMLGRPMTAAAVGLPFGIDVALWLIRRRPAMDSQAARFPTIAGFGVPLIMGWGVMLSYNHSITGDWLQSPYQLYTDIYTPRHVYGFNNVIRGERKLGPKVIDAYDRWTQNLTWRLAIRNLQTRWLSSWLWTLDIVPLLMTTVIFLGLSPHVDRRWILVAAALVSLHLWHVPYWYVGTMGWHYVFESAPLWCLLLGGVTGWLVGHWQRQGRPGLSILCILLLATSVVGAYVAPVPEDAVPPQRWKSRVQRGLGSLEHPRGRHLQMRAWVEDQVKMRPALVLVDQDTAETHLDLVVNDPALTGELLWGRFRPGKTDLAQIRRDFPDRHVYVTAPVWREIRLVD